MRTFVVLLLVANLGYFGWQYNAGVREKITDARAHAALPAATPGIKLVYELGELPPRRGQGEGEVGATQSAQPADTTAELTSIGDASDVCINVGPFATDEGRDDFQTWLRPRAAAVHTQTETIRKRKLFWVYLEADSEQAARDNLADLKNQGVSDYLLIRRGGLRNAISLGLFSSQASVNKRLAEMNRKGYKPVVVPRFETTDRHWIRATLAKGYENVTEVPPELLGGAQLSEIGCTEIAQAAPSS